MYWRGERSSPLKYATAAGCGRKYIKFYGEISVVAERILTCNVGDSRGTSG